MPKVTVCTQVYNTKPFLAQCIESVLNQTFQDFEYIIVDNGCTDGSQELLKQYAARDGRINLIRYEENIARCRWPEPVQKTGSGIYFANLDSDDWWELDYLEKLLDFMERNQLDIACTGTVMHVVATGAKVLRNTGQPLIFPRDTFAQGLPYYHAFLRPVWAKLIRMEYIKAVPLSVTEFPYGTDTLVCFECLRQAQRIGIDKSILQHYRIFSKSNSYQYDPRRFESDVYLYNDAVNFLSSFGPVSAQNRNFLQCVYSNAVIDTTGVIQNAALSPADKLREYCAIASHPITLAAYSECTGESADRSKNNLLVRALEAGAALGKQDDSDLRTVMQTLLPHCGQAVSAANARMFVTDQRLLQSLLRDNTDEVLEHLLSRMEQNQGVKKYNIPAALQALAADDLLLCQIDDAVFMRKYSEIYKLVWKGERLAALDKMTGLLLDNNVSSAQETFLTLFVALAAVENEPSAFVFGKLQLSKLYLRQNRISECRTAVTELEDMGLVENEEFSALCCKLQQLTQEEN